MTDYFETNCFWHGLGLKVMLKKGFMNLFANLEFNFMHHDYFKNSVKQNMFFHF